MGDIQFHIDPFSIILAVAAIWALRATLRQLKTMQEDSKTQIQIAKLMQEDSKTQIQIANQQKLSSRASVLLSLDERFGTQAMIAARNEMGVLIARVNQKAGEQWPDIALKEVRRRSFDTLYPQELEAMRKATPADSYGRLMVALSFFAILGHVLSAVAFTFAISAPISLRASIIA